jgi:signal transduction histidine kinase/DNA-binding response OmpR family regulator/streptogramin lyase
MWRTIPYYILGVFCSAQLLAQTTSTKQSQQFGTKDGLSHRWVFNIYQDEQQYLWLSTYDGLNRYDGNQFVTYRPSANGEFPAMADRTRQVFEMPNGHLLVNSEFGLFDFDPNTEQFLLLLKGTGKTAKLVINGNDDNAIIESFLEEWVFHHNPVTIYKTTKDGRLQQLATLRKPNRDRLYPVACNDSDAWFWDFEGHYHHFDIKTGKWEPIDLINNAKHPAPTDDKGQLWIPIGHELKPIPLPSATGIKHWKTFQLEGKKAVWLYGINGQDVYHLFRYDLPTGKWEDNLFSIEGSAIGKNHEYQTYLPSHFLDEEGTLWFAGFLGLNKIHRSRQLFRHYLALPVERMEAPPTNFSARNIWEAADGRLFVREQDKGVFELDPASGKVQVLDLPNFKTNFPTNDFSNDHTVSAICGDPEGNLWLYTRIGLLRFNPSTRQFKQFDLPFNAIASLHDDGLGHIWLCTNKEIYLLDKLSGKIEEKNQWSGYNMQYSVMMSSQKTLFILTDNGLELINVSDFSSKKIKLYDEPRDQRCLVFHDGFYWIGTSRGLEKVDPKTFAHTTFDRTKGLPGNFVYTIIADGDYLWLGTSDGLCRFRAKTGEIKNFYTEDGLSHYEFNTFSALKTRDGSILMGGLNGLNAFYPKDLEDNPKTKLRVQLSRLSLYDAKNSGLRFLRPSEYTDVVELAPSVSSLNLYLALTSYLDPNKNQFAWRMDGLDKDWYYAGNQHLISYQHLPPGSYTLHVKASDPFGNWSENELSIKIKMLRPWYSRWWAWMFYVAAIAGAAYWVYRFQLGKKMEHAENLRLRELDGFKSRFFTNITHEFRTPLTVILGLTDRLSNEQGRLEDSQTREKMGLIKRNGENLLRLINQLLDLAKLESNSLKMSYISGDVLPYLRYVTESLQSLANAKQVSLSLESEQAEIEMDYDPERLLQIGHNLLSNAIKFTPAGGRVVLKMNVDDANRKPPSLPFTKGPSSIIIQVSDTGTGIPPEDLPHVFDRFYQASNLEKAKAGGTGIGLSLVKELVKAMGGEISVESQLGVGSMFTVVLPLHQVEKEKSKQVSQILLPETKESSANRVVGFHETSPPENAPSVLLIEDNPDVMEYMKICLSGRYRLSFAFDGQAGIDAALETVPDLIVSDVMMPNKDGFEVCDFLKNDERTSHVPVVLLTAKADLESRIAGLKRGADAYLAKPFHQEELLATLQNLLTVRKKLQEKYSQFALQAGPVLSPEPKTAFPDIENAFLSKLRQVVERRYAEAELTVDDICREIGMSKSNLHQKLSALTGMSFIPYLRAFRLRRAEELLLGTEKTVSEVSFEVGFDDPKYFSRVFTEQVGTPPSEYRKK